MNERLKRFPHNRFIGTRDDMVVFDCDAPGQFEVLERRVDLEGLVGWGMLSTFGPDTAEEARNRGFTER